MVRYTKTGNTFTAATQTTGGTVADIPNHGVTVLNTTTAERWVLAPPVLGCRKLLVFGQSGTTGRTVELSTLSSGDSITLLPATGGAGTVTEIVVDTTNVATIELVGVSDTQWKLLYQTTGLPAALSTGLVYQAS